MRHAPDIEYRYGFFVESIDQSVLLIDATTPKTGQILFERLRFAKSLGRMPESILDIASRPNFLRK